MKNIKRETAEEMVKSFDMSNDILDRCKPDSDGLYNPSTLQSLIIKNL